jgi:hypothetical protein
MPIQPTGFNVPLLSPAGLISNQPQENPMQELLGRALDFTFQQRLQQQYIDAQTEAQQQRDERQTRANTESNIESALSRNLIAPVGSVDPLLMGEELPTFSFEGTRFGDRQFVSVERLEALRERRRLEGEASLPGFDFHPGTTQRMIEGPGGQQTGLIPFLARGDLAGLQEYVDAVPSSQPETKAAAQALVDRLRQDSFPSIAEVQEVRDQLSLNSMDIFAKSAEAERQYELERVGQMHRDRVSLMTQNTIIDPLTNQPRNLTPVEATAFAMYFADMPTTPEQDAILARLENFVRPRVTVADKQNLMLNLSAQSGAPNTPEIVSFSNWLVSRLYRLQNGKKTEPNKELIAEITNHGFGTDMAGIMQFAQSVVSEPYRNAYSLETYVGNNRSTIQGNMAGGQIIPFNVQGAYHAFEMLYGDRFNDVPAFPTTPQTSVGPQTIAQTEQEFLDGQSAYGADRQGLRAMLGEVDPNVSAAVNAIVRQDNLAEAVSAATAIARNTDREDIRAYMNSLANFISTQPEGWLLWRDSVAVPVFDNR